MVGRWLAVIAFGKPMPNGWQMVGSDSVYESTSDSDVTRRIDSV